MTAKNLVLDKKVVDNQYTYMFFKRIFDIILSAVGLLVLAIPCLIIALFIFACDRGPVFYTQERVGKDGKNL